MFRPGSKNKNKIFMPLIKPSMNKEKLNENVCVFSHTRFSD